MRRILNQLDVHCTRICLSTAYLILSKFDHDIEVKKISKGKKNIVKKKRLFSLTNKQQNTIIYPIGVKYLG